MNSIVNDGVGKTPILQTAMRNSKIQRCAKICQEFARNLQGICQEPAGQRLHLLTFLTYTRPVMPTKPQTAKTQNRGAAVTGLWPPSINTARPFRGAVLACQMKKFRIHVNLGPTRSSSQYLFGRRMLHKNLVETRPVAQMVLLECILDRSWFFARFRYSF